MARTYTKKEMENAVMLAADLYQRLYNADSTPGGSLEVANVIIDEACRMEKWLVKTYGEDDDSYLDRLEEYEAMMVKKYELDDRLPEITEPREVELYSIEPDGKGGKQIHIFAFTYASDNDTEDYWRLAEGTFIIVPLQEFIDNLKADVYYVGRLWCDTKQYEGDRTESQIVDAINHYFNGKTANAELAYSEITIDTPCGDYIC